MQNDLASMPIEVTIALGIIVVVMIMLARMLIISGIHERREQQIPWFHQFKIVAGIGMIIAASLEILSLVMSIVERSYHLSAYTVTLFSALGYLSPILLFITAVYAEILQMRNAVKDNK